MVRTPYKNVLVMLPAPDNIAGLGIYPWRLLSCNNIPAAHVLYLEAIELHGLSVLGVLAPTIFIALEVNFLSVTCKQPAFHNSSSVMLYGLISFIRIMTASTSVGWVAFQLERMQELTHPVLNVLTLALSNDRQHLLVVRIGQHPTTIIQNNISGGLLVPQKAQLNWSSKK